MKKTYSLSKKILSVFLAVVMCITMVTIAASGSSTSVDTSLPETCTDGGEHTVVTTVIAPNCTSEGFTLDFCTTCGEQAKYKYTSATGHNYEVTSESHTVYSTCTTGGGYVLYCTNDNCTAMTYQTGTETAALGHDYTLWYYDAYPSEETTEDEDGTYSAYAYMQTCDRDDCDYCAYEYNDTEVQKYYQVNFVNEYSATDFLYISYNSNECTDECSTAYKEYITGDGSNDYASLTTEDGCTAHDDVERYAIAWEEDVTTIYVKDGATAVYPTDEITPYRLQDLDAWDYSFSSWSNSSALEAVTENTTVTAVFTETEYLGHTVTFYNASFGQLTTTQTVDHGEAAIFPSTVTVPDKDSTLYYDYEFSGWSYDIEHIYAPVDVYPVYEAVPIEYTLVLCDYDGTEIDRQTMTLGEAIDMDSASITAHEFVRKDDSYIYAFAGAWVRSTGETIDNDYFTVPSDTTGTAIKVYASYSKMLITYTTNFELTDPYGLPAENAKITILDSSGSLYTSATITDDNEITLSIPYGTYTVIISSETGKYTLSTLLYVTGADDEGKTYDYQLEINESYDDGTATSCACICHGILGDVIWIPILNILYSVFGTEYMCCDDMYATHGDKLLYY